MFDVFITYLSTRTVLTDKELGLIASLSKEKFIAKKAFLLKEGDVSAETNFITHGLLRKYRTDDDGVEYILRFAMENQWMNDRESYLSGKPAVWSIDAIEETGVWRGK